MLLFPCLTETFNNMALTFGDEERDSQILLPFQQADKM